MLVQKIQMNVLCAIWLVIVTVFLSGQPPEVCWWSDGRSDDKCWRAFS